MHLRIMALWEAVEADSREVRGGKVDVRRIDELDLRAKVYIEVAHDECYDPFSRRQTWTITVRMNGFLQLVHGVGIHFIE